MSHRREPLVLHYLSISLLSTDTVTLLTRLQSRWLSDYFQSLIHPPRLKITDAIRRVVCGWDSRHCAKHTTWIFSLTILWCNYSLPLPHFYRWINWDIKQVKKLAQSYTTTRRWIWDLTPVGRRESRLLTNEESILINELINEFIHSIILCVRCYSRLHHWGFITEQDRQKSLCPPGA